MEFSVALVYLVDGLSHILACAAEPLHPLYDGIVACVFCQKLLFGLLFVLALLQSFLKSADPLFQVSGITILVLVGLD